MRKYPLPQVLDWLAQDIQYVAEAGVDPNVIKKIRSDHGVDKFAMVLIDGSEIPGEVEYSKINGAGIHPARRYQ